MSTIGYFRRDGDGFSGRLATLALAIDLTLVPADKFSSKAPDYQAMVGQAEVGVGWKLSDASGALLSLKLDDPTWAEPINARLMAAEDGAFPLVWIRRADPPTPAAAPAPTPPPA